MPIDGTRKLKVGTMLEARYKGETHKCEVVSTPDGIRYRLVSSNAQFKSPSAAGSAVMGGIACNGWRFWSTEADATAAAEAKAERDGQEQRTVDGRKAKRKAAKKTAKPKADRKRRKKAKAATQTPNTPAEALAEEQVKVDKEVAQIKGGFEHLEDGRYFCPGCMDSFATDTDEEPKVCPEGHTPVGVGEELAAAAD